MCYIQHCTLVLPSSYLVNGMKVYIPQGLPWTPLSWDPTEPVFFAEHSSDTGLHVLRGPSIQPLGETASESRGDALNPQGLCLRILIINSWFSHI